MLNSIKKMFEDDPLLTGFFLACLGGIVRGIRCRSSEFTAIGFSYRVLSAGFVGILTSLMMTHTEWSPQIEAAFIGACGYAAVDILQDVPVMIKECIRKRFK